MAASRTYLENITDGVDRSTYTFTSRSLGTAASDRYILVCAGSRATGTSAFSVTGVTVGGVAATILLSQSVTSGTGTGVTTAAMAIVAIPSGTSGTIVVTFPRTALRLSIVTYALYDINQTPADTAVEFAVTGDLPATSIDIPANGIAIGFDVGFINSSGFTWTGLTQDVAALRDSFLGIAAASDSSVTPVSGRSVSCDFSNSTPTERIELVAAWGPPGGTLFRRTLHNRSGSRAA